MLPLLLAPRTSVGSVRLTADATPTFISPSSAIGMPAMWRVLFAASGSRRGSAVLDGLDCAHVDAGVELGLSDPLVRALSLVPIEAEGALVTGARASSL